MHLGTPITIICISSVICYFVYFGVIGTLQQYNKYLSFLPACYLKTMTADCSVSLCSWKPLMTSNTKPERTSKSCYTKLTHAVIAQERHTQGVTVLRWTNEADFCPLHCISRFIVRDFLYNEEEMKADKEEMTRLSTDKKKQFVSNGTGKNSLRKLAHWHSFTLGSLKHRADLFKEPNKWFGIP